MKYYKALGISRGITALIGGGGKTSLLMRLAQELSSFGTVIVGATAKMYPPQGMCLVVPPDEAALKQAMTANRLVCAGRLTSKGKITLEDGDVPMLGRLADYVLLEADGSNGRPLKAHALHEPALPEGVEKTVLVIGIDGLGKPISLAAHRPELYAKILNKDLAHLVQAEDAAKVAAVEALHDCVFINKVENEAAVKLSFALAAMLYCPVAAGALLKEIKPCLLR
ncbi:MAG TPA: selenium cofactor biosynthesis protein YqeC [Clostridia bacterium]|nr:selenium cofactor biosynthesis protein YqeC [Clostridia bacterium]